VLDQIWVFNQFIAYRDKVVGVFVRFRAPLQFVQLIITIGKARTFDKTLCHRLFLGAFDFKKAKSVVPYINIQIFFYINDLVECY
jgi:hypothetical protein